MAGTFKKSWARGYHALWQGRPVFWFLDRMEVESGKVTEHWTWKYVDEMSQHEKAYAKKVTNHIKKRAKPLKAPKSKSKAKSAKGSTRK